MALNNLFAVLIDPAMAFGLEWKSAEVEEFLNYLHDTPPAPGFDRVQYPGEYEARNREIHASHLDIAPAIWRSLAGLAQSLGVAVPA
jgi:L-lactate dehydrogenase